MQEARNVRLEGEEEAANTEQRKLRKEAPVGILRLDSTRPRRIPLEIHLLMQGEPPSPQPSVDRLSVTFAEDSVRSDCPNPNTSQETGRMHLPTSTTTIPTAVEDSDEEDYSASVNAIIQRKASTRRSRRHSKRRPSSPFSPDILPGTDAATRRRSSVYTSSSGETVITIDESLAPELTQDQIFENIRLHKEVLSNVKMQPWNMRKKLKLVMQAKSYVKKHEGALQERFTQTHSIANILARWNIYLIKRWHRCRREMANFSNLLIPWERRIKEIESHFGSVVASYFIFLRWLFWVNVVIAGILVAFVAVPEIIITSGSSNSGRKEILPEDKYNATNFLTLWDFEGVLKYTPLFYGWYTNKDNSTGYRLPLAYFLTQIAVYVYSFVATLRKMAENSRMSKLSEKDDECVFTWKLFAGWDYMIGNPETAHNRVMSTVMSLKEALLEEAEKNRKERNWKIIWTRVFVNLLVLGLFALSAAAVVVVVGRSTEPEANSDIWRRNETTVVMTLISFIFPMILEILGLMEHYHPRKQLRIQLARIMLLNLLNLYALIFAQFDKINDMSATLLSFKPNVTPIPVDALSSNDVSTMFSTTEMQTQLNNDNTICEIICSNITDIQQNVTMADVISLVATTALPVLVTYISTSTTPNDSSLYLNETENFEKLGENIPDYLTFLLRSFNFTNSTDFLNFTEGNLTNSWQENSTVEYFKTTMKSYLNITPSEIDEKLTELYEETASMISGEQEDADERFVQEKCEQHCYTPSTTTQQSVQESSTSVATPTANILDSSVGNYLYRIKLRSLCWETMFGQELVKLTVLDLVFTVAGTVGIDFVRGIFVRVMNRCWCWDLEKKFPEYGEFKVAENILHLVNNQGMVWMGMFFSPGLVSLNVCKLVLLMYLRSWAVLTCNVPHAVIFRASRSNNFYFALLLTMLFLCVLPVGYAIVWVEPSWHCGPFSNNLKIFHVLTRTIRKIVPKKLHKAMDYVVSPGIVIPLLVLLILIIYYLISLTNSLREANVDLKIQLRQERTEERRKMFKLADRRRLGGSGGSGELENTPFAKWKKLMGTLPTGKSMDETPKETSAPNEDKPEITKTKALMSKFIRRALRKPSVVSEDDSEKIQADDATDNEQPDSLPEDVSQSKTCVKSTETKHVQIAHQTTPDLYRNNSQVSRKDSFDSNRKQDWRRHSSGSKETRQDSINSNWSDNIPVITISKIENSEHLKRENSPDISAGAKDEPDQPKACTFDDKERFRPKVKYVLRKQSEVIEKDVGEEIEESEEESTKTTVKSKPFDKRTDSQASDTAKTESSADYNDKWL